MVSPALSHDNLPEMNARNSADLQRKQILGDAYLREAYETVYGAMIGYEKKYISPGGKRIEIGSAGGFLREIDPDIETTDIRAADGVSRIMDATRMDYPSNSVSTIFAKDALHHIPDVEKFFRELIRICVPGGGMVAIEPYWGPLAQLIYIYFHPEDYDKHRKSWDFPSSDPMQSNQALPYLLAVRDREIFATKFPQIEVMIGTPLVGPSYILSGGITRPKMLPASILKRLLRREVGTNLWRKWGALSVPIVFRLRR